MRPQEAPLSARAAALLITFLLAPGLAAAGPITPTAAEATARSNLGATLPTAKLLWVRSDKIYFSSVASFKEQLVTSGSYAENNPRWSPDGSQILFTRVSDGVYVMKADFSGKAKLISGGHTASWTRDGKAITAVDASGYKVVQYELATKKLTTIYDAQVSPYNGQKVSQAAELRTGGRFLLVFRLTPTHTTEIVDLQSKTYISNTEMQRGDCSPAWAPDGSYLITTARLTSRPVLKADFSASAASVSASKHFVGLDTSAKFYIHGERVSNDGEYVTFGGKLFSGAGSNGDREIYIWKVGGTDKDAVRMTFETNEDMTPSLFIPPAGSSPKLALSPSTLSFSATEGGSDPSGQSVAVNNSGAGTLAAISTSTSYGSGSGSGWLKTVAGGSANSQSVANAVSIAGLSPNTYSATVSVSATGAQNSPQSYSVILTVKEQPKLDAGVTSDSGGGTVPKLGLSPSTLSFSTGVGGSAPAAKTVNVSNTGGGTLGGVKAAVSYLGGSSGWLGVSTGGSQNAQSVTNTVTISGLSANTYSATVQVSAAGASNSPQTYAVTLTVTDLPQPDAGPLADATPPVGDAAGTADGPLATEEGGAGNPQDAVTLEGGCGCRLGSHQAEPTALSLTLLLGLLLLIRRRRAGCESFSDEPRQSRSGRGRRR